MLYYPLSRCGLFFAILLSVMALREGEDEGHISFLQVDFARRPWPNLELGTVYAHSSRERNSMLESSGVLHIPYGHVALNLTYTNLWEQIITFPQRRPWELNVMLATCKTWTADAIVQFGEHRRGTPWKFDWSRSVAFALFGLVYIGIAQWILYVSVLTWLFPEAMIFANAPLALKLKDQTGMIDMVGQVCVDNFIFEVLIYFPVFYTIKALMQGKESFPTRIQNGLSKYRTNLIADNLASFAVWIPADVVIFACPMYLRMPMEHCVSFGWTMFISATRGASEKADSKYPTDVSSLCVADSKKPDSL